MWHESEVGSQTSLASSYCHQGWTEVFCTVYGAVLEFLAKIWYVGMMHTVLRSRIQVVVTAPVRKISRTVCPLSFPHDVNT